MAARHGLSLETKGDDKDGGGMPPSDGVA